MPSKYIFVMKDLNKTWAGGKQVIKNGSLSFIDGAKIGVLGINGAGKSTLLKIMSGLDKEFSGEVWAAEGIRVGYLSQEPVLEDSLNVIENVKTGLSHITKLLKEFEKITGVPVLLNTSFNVAGKPLIETVNDAIDTFKKTSIDVLWFPKKKIILTK